jgi:hypothetical protein
MKKLYWTLMAVGGALALVPGLQFALVVLSFGLLVPILFLPTIAYYGLAILPFELLGSIRILRFPSVLVSIVMLTALLFVPGHLIRLKSKEVNEQAQKLALIFPSQKVVVSIDAPFGQQTEPGCNNLCDALLNSSRVSAVQVLDSKASFNRGRTYSVLADKSCLDANALLKENLLRLERILDGEKCLVSTNIKLDEQVRLTFEYPMSQGDLDPGNRLSISVLRDQEWKVEMKDSSGTYSVPHFPPYIDFVMEGGIVSGGSRFAGEVRVVNDLILGQMFVGADDTFQFSQKSLTAAETDSAKLQAILVSLLARKPPGYKLNLENAELFRQYVDTLHLWRGRNAETTAFLRQLLGGDNIGLDINMMTTLSNVPELIDLAAPQIIRRFKSECEKSVHNLLFRLSPEALEPFKIQLINLRATSSECQREALSQMSGLLGDDPTPFLTALMKSGRYGDQITALEAMCRSDPRWAVSLIPLILQDMPLHCVSTDYYGHPIIKFEKQLSALQNLGGHIQVVEWLKNCTAEDNQHYKQILSRKSCD